MAKKISIFEFGEHLGKIIEALFNGARGVTIDVSEKYLEFKTKNTNYRLNKKLIVVYKNQTIDGRGVMISHKEMEMIIGRLNVNMLKGQLDSTISFIAKDPINMPMEEVSSIK